MKLNHAIDLSAAVENAAEITHLSASNVTQCVKNCDIVVACDDDPPVTQCAKNCDVRLCDRVASSTPVTQCVKSCDIVGLCDDGSNNPSQVTQSEKLCDLVSKATYSCDIRPK